MFADRTLYASSVIGTGPYTLTAAVGSFKSWRSQFADLSTVFYCAENSDGTIWEIGYGTLTYGSPDTISRTLVSSSTGSLIAWVGADAPIYVFSIPTAAALEHALFPLSASRPAWLQASGRWIDYSLGLTVTWIKNLWTGSANIEEGRVDIAKGIYIPSPRRAWTAVGAANKTVAAADIGGVFTQDNAAADRTFTLPASGAAGVGHGFKVGGLGLTSGGQYGIVLTPAATDGIEGGADAATLRVLGGVRFDVEWDAPGDTWRVTYLNTVPTVWSGRRQVVAAGPVSTAGLPTFLPSTNGALSLTMQNVTATARFVATAANGWDWQGRPNDRVGVSLTNLQWTGLTASRAAATPNFLYVTVNADGTLTTGSTILAPVYQHGGTPATTSGQYTFNIAEMRGYFGNGSTAPEAFVVFVGEAATDGTGVISTVAYAYNGRYESALTATLPAAYTATAVSHNIGEIPRIADWRVRCTTTEYGYAVGDEISSTYMYGSDGSVNVPFQMSASKLSLSVLIQTYVSSNHKTTGARSDLTRASWSYRFVADRGWG